MTYALVESEARLFDVEITEDDAARYTAVCQQWATSEIEEALVNHAEEHDRMPTPAELETRLRAMENETNQMESEHAQ